jgi:hypothetical protein
VSMGQCVDPNNLAASMRRVRNRIYSDFMMPSRLGTYRKLLELALEAGYQICSVGSVWRQIAAGGLRPSQRYLVLRHDVDTDPRTAAEMWSIDRALGLETSYFFRLSTMAPELMADVAAGGGEASYHYEELSSVAKLRRLRTRTSAMRALPEARERFAENVHRLRLMTGLPMRVVASHGDFVNRRLGVANWLVLADPEFRREVQVDLETYDDELLRHLPQRQTDAPYPRYWEPVEPVPLILRGEPVLSVLVHPRHWRVDRLGNARDDVMRAYEGLRFSLPHGPR